MVGNNGFIQGIIFSCILYFIVTSVLTIYKTYVTTRGVFYSFFTVLFLLLVSLLVNVNNFIVYQQSILYKAVFGVSTWYLPELGISINLDCLCYLFMLLVVTIGFCTNIYILNYFKYEANEVKFIILINWFIIGMLLLVAANNFFTLFLGWELIGLTSFFLINFWSERRGTLKSSFKAFTFNKISDFFLFSFIVLMWLSSGVSSIDTFNFLIQQPNFILDSRFKVGGILLILCSSIKSAQIIGHLWLPDSMEAPVPASALIHSATLVSAGLYLILRFNILLTSLDYNYWIILLGSVTAAYGGIVAASQTDMKKLLAYSTISHCGFLFVCAGIQNYYLVIIYLFMHGIFKALTFFCVGSFIRVAGTQDTRNMGVLSRYLPVDTIYLIIAASNLGGLPLSFGYIYKNYFLLSIVQSTASYLVVGFCFVGMLTSIIYVYRLVYYSAFDYNKGSVNLQLKTTQDNEQADKKYWSASTAVQSIAVLVMFLFSIYIYIIFLNYCFFSGLEFNNFPIKLSSNPDIVADSQKIYASYLNFFYILYTLVIIIICLLENRRTYTWTYKIHFLAYTIFITLALVLILC